MFGYFKYLVFYGYRIFAYNFTGYDRYGQLISDKYRISYVYTYTYTVFSYIRDTYTTVSEITVYVSPISENAGYVYI